MKVAVILGSTREGRVGDRVAKWVVTNAGEVADTEVNLVDLRDYELSFLRDPSSPRYTPDRKVQPETQRWLDAIAAADAYVFVMPEYNRSFPGELKNAIDHIGHEADKKPAAIVSYSMGATGGLAAQQQLRPVLNNLEIVTISSVVTLGGVPYSIDEEGELSEDVKANPYGPQTALTSALSELKWYSDALAAARNQ